MGHECTAHIDAEEIECLSVCVGLPSLFSEKTMEQSSAHPQEADMEDGALVRVVGALVENPAVQQHVLRLLDVQVDGVAANCREMEVKRTKHGSMQVKRESIRDRDGMTLTSPAAAQSAGGAVRGRQTGLRRPPRFPWP